MASTVCQVAYPAPKTNLRFHSFGARLAVPFGTIIHFDLTRVGETNKRGAAWPDAEMPQTFPIGL